MSQLGTHFLHSHVDVRCWGIQTWVIAMSQLGTNFFQSDVDVQRWGIPTWASAMSQFGTNLFHTDVDVRRWGHSNRGEHDVRIGNKPFSQRCRCSTLGAFKHGRARHQNWEQTFFKANGVKHVVPKILPASSTDWRALIVYAKNM